MSDIGRNIQQLRAQKGLTQEEMAERLFVTRQTVSNYENGRTSPDPEMLGRIAAILEVEPGVLFAVPEEPKPQTDAPAKAAERFPWRSALMLLLLFLLRTLVLYPMVDRLRSEYFLSAPRMLMRLAFDPLFLLLLGWWMIHLVIFLLHAPALPWPRKRRTVRRVVLLLLALHAAVFFPYLLAFGSTIPQFLLTGKVHMSFPYLPVYSEILSALEMLCYKFPLFYLLPGGLLRLLGFPARLCGEEKSVLSDRQ